MNPLANNPEASVLISSMCIPGAADGGSLTSKWLMYALRNKGVRVTLCSSDYGSTVMGEADSDIQIFPRTLARPMDFSIGLCRFLWKRIGSSTVCHFFAFYATATVWGTFLARRHGVPYVVSPMGNTVPANDDSKSRNFGNLKKRLYFHLLGKSILRNAAFIICATEMEREKIRRHLPEGRFVVLPHGVNRTDDKPDGRALILPRHSQLVLFLGRLSPEKSLPFMFDTWADVRRSLPDALLVIAGDDRLCPGYEKVLRVKVTEMGLNESIHFVGAVDSGPKKWLFEQCACLVLPSTSENFGYVVVEALSAGRPAITSTGTPWQKLEEDGVGAWLPLDRKIWADRLVQYLGNDGPVPDPNSAQRCRDWVTRNVPDWDEVAEKQIRVYEQSITSIAEDVAGIPPQTPQS
jgi:glycosyltransferase involved in cell wall biosynthesis